MTFPTEWDKNDPNNQPDMDVHQYSQINILYIYNNIYIIIYIIIYICIHWDLLILWISGLTNRLS